MRLTCAASVVILALSASPAFADATLFAGTTSAPTPRQAIGVAIGMSVLVVGFEFEYSATSEEARDAAPSLQTGMGNVFLQTPGAIAGFQPYLTAGAGAYRERLGGEAETQLGMNSGGGVKIRLAGPVGARVDYRLFRLSGNPLHPRTQRLYAGLNLRF